jgi:hypothetical protein
MYYQCPVGSSQVPETYTAGSPGYWFRPSTHNIYFTLRNLYYSSNITLNYTIDISQPVNGNKIILVFSS